MTADAASLGAAQVVAPLGATPTPTRPRDVRWAYVAVLLQTTIAVATTFIAKAALAYVPAYALTFLRLLGATVVMGGMLLWRGVRPWRLPRRDLGTMAVLGLLGMTLNQTLFLRGLLESTPGHASLLYALTPLFVLLIGASRGVESLSRAKVLGVTCAFVGVLVVLLETDGLAGVRLRGDLILLGGVVAWAAYSALGKPILARYDTVTVTATSLFFGALFMAPVGAAELVQVELLHLPTWALWSIVYLILFGSVAAYLLWYAAIRHLPPSRVAVFMNLQPPAVVALSWFTAHEPITPAFLLGAGLVLVGVRWVGRSR